MLVLLVGDVGSGKTLFATRIALRVKKPVYANYTIKIPNHVDLTPEILNVINEPSLVILDEAYAWLESRMSGKPINLYMSYILFQSRKLGLDFMLTQQLAGTIDLRFREMANWVIECEYVPEVGFRYTFYKVNTLREMKPFVMLLPLKEAEKVYPYYDSWQRINPIDSDLLVKVSDNKKSIMNDVDSVVDELLKIAPAHKWSRGIITDYVLRNNLPRTWIDMVLYTIKARDIFKSAEKPV
jgi:adenylate kinase family enzyme